MIKGNRIACAAIAVLLTTTLTEAQELRDTLFKDADAALAAAKQSDAEALSPRNFKRAMDAYSEAEEGFRRGRNIDTIRKRLSEATTHFNAASKAAGLASISLAAVIKTREDARNADGPTLSEPIWKDAEKRFKSAVTELENGDLKDSKRRATEAESLYRDAELGAIKTRYLSETRRLLSDAERGKVARYAPTTLEQATRHLQRAEKELNENRYDTDLPRSLAQQANYEARHAIYLAELVRKVNDKQLSVEQLVLDWEKPLIAIAGAADVVPDLAGGNKKLTEDLTTYVEDLRAQNQALEQDLNDSTTRLTEIEEEVRILDEKLGGATEERQALQQRLEHQARIKAQFEQVEKMFTRDKAQVFREGNDVTLRLVGLSFASGSSQVDAGHYPLLKKVEQALGVFPRSALVVEGHTDSYGSDDNNVTLSQARADAVKSYMINAMRIPTNRLTATGYGETRPIANNETTEGRARNRRIDIVMRPQLD